MADILLDTFTGSGSLDGHVGDNGLTWFADYGPLSDMLLSAGEVYADPLVSYPPYIMPAGGVVLPHEFNLDINFTLAPIVGQNGELIIQFRTAYTASASLTHPETGEANGHKLDMVFYLDGTVGLDVNRYSPTESTFSYSDPPIASGAHTLRIEMTTTTRLIYLDGVVVASFSGPDTGVGLNGLNFYSAKHVRLDSIHVYSTGVEPEPPAGPFWRDLLITKQIPE